MASYGARLLELPPQLSATLRAPRFVCGLRALDDVLLTAKLMICPHCLRAGMLVGHGFLMGYAERTNARVVRGRRLLCSSRFLRSGCGRTFSIWLADVIKGFTVRTGTLTRLLNDVVRGLCVNVAWERDGITALCLRSGFRLWRRMLAAQSHLRSTLLASGPPPASTDTRPFAQLLDHLRCVLGSAECLFASFQHTFQRSVLG